MTTKSCSEKIADTNGEQISIVVECAPSPRPATETTTAPAPAPVQVAQVDEGGGAPVLFLLALAVCAVGCAVMHPLTRTHARRVLGWPMRAKGGAGLLLRSALLFGVLFVAALLLWQARTLLAVGGLVALGVVLWMRRAPVDGAHWYDEAPLVDALLLAGVLRMSRTPEGPVRPRLGRHGAPQVDEHGAAVTVVLPRGMTWSAVAAHHEALASALGVPAAHLTVTGGGEAAAPNVVRLRVGATPPREVKRSAAEGATGATWGVPIRLGEDERGRPVRLQVENTHTLVAGASGSGKTLTSRIVALTAALDPRVTVLGLDGKGDGLDWAPLVPSCREFIDGVRSAEDVERLVGMLQWVLDESERIRARALVTNERPRPSVLLILEEFYVARATAVALDKAQGKVLDSLLTRILAGARSAGVHVLVITQRGTDTYVPNDMQANIAQRVVGHFAKRTEFLWALGDEPVREPGAPGEFVVRGASGQAFMHADLLTDQAWQEGCRRAAALRGGVAPAEPVQARTADPEPVFDLLGDSVRRVLLDGPPEGMSATELLARMDALSRPDSPLALGRALKARPGAFVMTRTDARRWNVVKASETRRVSVVKASSDGGSPVVGRG